MQLSSNLPFQSPMLAVSHSLAHRGSGATRPRAARWQPYASIPATATPRSSYTPYLNTPASSVSSSPPILKQIPPVCASEQSRNSPTASTSLTRHASLRDLQKSRYVNALVDQTVKSLGEIWPAQDVPAVFSVTTPRNPVTSTQSCPDLAQPTPLLGGAMHANTFGRNAQLLSPVTPSTHPSPYPTPSTSPAAPLTQHHQRRGEASTDQARAAAAAAAAVPLRCFVQEILRRSKTSAGVLQTALCYLEALRVKVPDLVLQEKLGLGSQPELVVEDLIVRAELLEEGAMFDLDGAAVAAADRMNVFSDLGPTDTIRVDDALLPPSPASPLMEDASVGGKKLRATAPPPTPLPAQPSPLLCPRRAFLGALVLATKFTQDKAYSNKAWARIAGLPAREVGRCERALGAALEWRLWVGKMPPMPVNAMTTARIGPSGRPVSRTRSDGDVFAAPPAPAASEPVPVCRPCLGVRQRSGLSRSSTLPAGALADGFASAPLAFGPAPLAAPSYVPARMYAVESPGSMPTPTLSYSPASTASLGDPTATIRMATFSDVPDVYSPAVVPCGNMPMGSCPAPAYGFEAMRSDVFASHAEVFVKPTMFGQSNSNTLRAAEWLASHGVPGASVGESAMYDHWTE